MKLRAVLAVLAVCLMGLFLFGCGSDAADNVKDGKAKAAAVDTGKAAAAERTADTAKSLVVYFSWSGNTEFVANEIAQETGADVFRVVPADASRYNADYDTVVDIAKKEIADNVRPEFSGSVDNLDQYDTIYLGYPCWWGDMPMVMYSFLDKYDLSGKRLAPFTTNEGSGFGNSLENIAKAEPNAKMIDGLQLRGKQARNSVSQIKAWVDSVKAGK